LESRIRIKVKSRIRIRIKRVWIRNTAGSPSSTCRSNMSGNIWNLQYRHTYCPWTLQDREALEKVQTCAVWLKGSTCKEKLEEQGLTMLEERGQCGQ
jgi:hypothetical protein